jgi:ligand-binding SRPBCC domain-containing protein
MKYTHRFQVKAPLSSVAAFHHQQSNMGAITPPPIRAELHRVPADGAGGEMAFTLWLGPLPVHWMASIEDISQAGFTDRQLSGPFSEWVHRHSFIRLDDHTTEVVDQISLKLKPRPVWGLVGLAFTLGLPALFAYRAWKTRRLLEKGPAR